MNFQQIEHAITAVQRLERKLIEAAALPVSSPDRRNRLASCHDNLETIVACMERQLADELQAAE